MVDFQPLRDAGEFRASQAKSFVRELSESALASTVSKRWSTDAMVIHEPFQEERVSLPQRWLRAGERPKADDFENGVDEEGRVLWSRSPATKGEPEKWTFAAFPDERTTLAYWLPRAANYLGKRPELVTAARYDAQGRLTTLQRTTSRSTKVEVWEYPTSSLITLRVGAFNFARSLTSRASSALKVRPRSFFVYEFETDHGSLQKLYVTKVNEAGEPTGEKRLKYKRSGKGRSLAQLSANVGDALVEAVRKAAVGVERGDTYSAMILVYSQEDFESLYPPLVLLVPEAYSKTCEDADDGAYRLWAPDEIRAKGGCVTLVLEDAQLGEMCLEHLDRMRSEGRHDAGRKTLVEAAKRLGRSDWSTELSVTSDFVVAAVDNSGQRDPKDDVRAAVSAAKAKSLVRRGLL